jgi:hypothetical protein
MNAPIGKPEPDGEPLYQFVIYERPADCPEGYVLRSWIITAGRIAPGGALAFATLEDARKLLREAGCVCIGRSAADDPCIVETWM